MAKGGPLKFLLPAALGIGALATGGFGLPALLGGEAAGAGADIGAAAGEAAAGAGEAAAAPLTAGSEFLIPGTDTALTTGAAGLGGAPIVPEFTGGLDVGTAAGAAPFAGLQSAGDFITGGGQPVIDALSSQAPLPTDAQVLSQGGLLPSGAPAPLTAGAPVGAVGQPISSAVAAADPTGGPFTVDQLFDPNNPNALAVAGGPTGIPGDTATATGAEDGGIFGTGVTGGDIFKNIGGLRGLTGLLSAGLLGSQLFRGVQQYPEQKTLGGQAAGYTATGNALEQPLFTGALPTGAESAVDLATAASKARISGAYARLGLSGSTMESEALNQADQQAAAQKFAISDKLLGQALDYSRLGTATTQGLLKTSMEEDQQYREALANFAKALAGTGGGIGSTTSPTYTLTPTA